MLDIHSLTYFVVTNGLLLGGTALLGAMLIRMDKIGLRRSLPIFFAYLAFSLWQTVSYAVFRGYFGPRSQEYFILYWLEKVVDVTLALFVVQEVYASALYKYEALRSISRALFRWAVGVLVVVAIASSASPRAVDMDYMYNCILLFYRGTMIVQVGLLALLFLLARTLAFGWRQRTFGIAFGMCFLSGLQVVGLTWWVQRGTAVAELYALVKPFIVVAAFGIWTAYLYRSESTREVRQLNNVRLDHWNGAVLQFLNR